MKRNAEKWIILLFLSLMVEMSVMSADPVYAASAMEKVIPGCQRVAGKWVYDGEDGYYQKRDGVFYRGWLAWKDHIYYLSKSSGIKAVGFHTISGKRYFFRRNSGRLMRDGWFQVDGKKYYAASNGVLQTGWFNYKGSKYFLNKNGVMRTGWVKIQDEKYYFYPDGKMAENLWLDEKHYVDENGVLESMTAKEKKTTFRWPLNDKWNSISSYFGYRGYMPIGTSDHDGIDIPADMNTPIRAARAGTIITRNYNDSAGNHIEIDHHNGLATQYMHMTRFEPSLKRGSKVKKGQIIGYVGTTGWSTGPHLHFGVMVNGVKTNPLEFVRQP